jgi:lambda family phage portal protein
LIAGMVDSIVAAFSPAAGLRRQQARKLLRNYQGAERTRLNSNKRPQNLPADTEIGGALGADALRARARMLVRDNAYAWGVVDTIVSSVVGCGIEAMSALETPLGQDREELNEIRQTAWQRWMKHCDYTGRFSFNEIQGLIQREMVEAGEVLVRFRNVPLRHKGVDRQIPLALEMIEADQLASERDTLVIRPETGIRISRGVETDIDGKVLAYWLYPEHPLSPYHVRREPVRVPASEVLHLYRTERIGQHRGVTWFHPVIQWLHDLGMFVDNELQASAVASCFAVAIKRTTPIGGLNPPSTDGINDADGNRYDYVQPGMIMHLNPDEDISAVSPGRPNSAAEPWLHLMLRGIAIGTGLSYETVGRDYSQTNFSSNRASQLEDRRRFKVWQRYLIDHLCNPVWMRFCQQAAVAGVPGFPTAADFLADPEGVCPAEWQAPGWEWVDPMADQQSSEAAIRMFQTTYANELGQKGRNWRHVFYQRAQEEALLQRLGLVRPEIQLAEAQVEPQMMQAQTQAELVEGQTTAADADGAQPQDVRPEDSALNGAQVTSLVEIIAQVGTGALPKTSAKALITAAFPMMAESEINAMLADIQPGTVVDPKLAQSQEVAELAEAPADAG